MQQYRVGDCIIAWKKIWDITSSVHYKVRPEPAIVLGVYNRIIRTDLGDYTAWQLERAEQWFRSNGKREKYGYDNY